MTPAEKKLMELVGWIEELTKRALPKLDSPLNLCNEAPFIKTNVLAVWHRLKEAAALIEKEKP